MDLHMAVVPELWASTGRRDGDEPMSLALTLAEYLLDSGDWEAETPYRWIDLRRVRLGENPRAIDLPTAAERQSLYEKYEDANA
jgi:hypothetical protein